MKECITHHICDCKQAQFEKLQIERDSAIEVLRVLTETIKLYTLNDFVIKIEKIRSILENN